MARLKLMVGELMVDGKAGPLLPYIVFRTLPTALLSSALVFRTGLPPCQRKGGPLSRSALNLGRYGQRHLTICLSPGSALGAFGRVVRADYAEEQVAG